MKDLEKEMYIRQAFEAEAKESDCKIYIKGGDKEALVFFNDPKDWNTSKLVLTEMMYGLFKELGKYFDDEDIHHLMTCAVGGVIDKKNEIRKRQFASEVNEKFKRFGL